MFGRRSTVDLLFLMDWFTEVTPAPHSPLQNLYDAIVKVVEPLLKNNFLILKNGILNMYWEIHVLKYGLFTSFYQWDPGTRYKCTHPMIVKGGYAEWLRTYPTYTTNALVSPPPIHGITPVDHNDIGEKHFYLPICHSFNLGLC